jgi:hypothetical protein
MTNPDTLITSDTDKRKIYIYCDGGFANRVNALIFGKHIARLLNLAPKIFWPTNNWFGASYSDIFSGESEAINEAIHQINFASMNCIGILHDNIPITFLRSRDTKLISDFSTKEGFCSYLRENDDKDIFLYTALIPEWVSEGDFSEIIRETYFNKGIIQLTRNFLATMPPGGFYGLHLRRTDLVSGLNDQEVFSITSSHPHATFFVCSDSIEAEDIACYQPNCRRYLKNSYVEKRIANDPWNSPITDDSGRTYNGNISRGRQASIDAVVDFLILTHATILGNSGSTFHALARRAGRYLRICSIGTLPLINALSFSDSKKRFSRWAIDYPEAVGVLDHYCRLQEPSKALELLFLSLQACDEDSWNNLAIALSNLLIHYQRIELALPILSFISTSSPDRARAFSFGLGQATILKLLGRDQCANELLDRYIVCASEAQLREHMHLIAERFPESLVANQR